tara:strand:+ start:410 stop:985 length:576 start_codon:yes stop_codon:yes gene_type:complete
MSLTRKNKLYGVGINDADYVVSKTSLNKYKCPFYERWSCMIKRCYSAKYQEKQPSYIGCSVVDSWLTFSNFRLWMLSQDWNEKHLDKDILTQGNKIYSPESCLFVTREINILLTEAKANIGTYPTGVSFNANNNKFTSQISIKGKRKSLGYFLTQKQAFDTYKEAKYRHIKDVALKQAEPLRSALLAHIIQ